MNIIIQGDIVNLSELVHGQTAVIEKIKSTNLLFTRLQRLGVEEGESIRCLYESPWQDPVAYEVCGSIFALRKADACEIIVS